MNRRNNTDYLIVLFTYIGLSAIPFSLFVKTSWLIIVFQIIAQIISLVFIFWFSKRKSQLDLTINAPNKKALLFIPGILVCASNFVYFIFKPESFNFSFHLMDVLTIVLYLFVAANEELLFRVVLMNNFFATTKFKKVLLCALIFSISHITVFVSTFNFYDLIIIVYTFFLGLLLCTLFMETKSYSLAVLFHFLFNAINKVMFECCSGNVQFYSYYLLGNGIVVAVVACYFVALKQKGLILNDEE